ncbi:heme ABC transporter ATP-binding protein [Stappia taiwanensis]|uniref:Heme ABC transporter ATP-binding protein n=1 Tax=Stappia taiwanensis TaxID=992267 RepID=A0A838XWY5_9HYPH|nr:heme ABC transporter ATP-binding protein [Stappia taiwanensis]MBA4613078.1 heme ABC transporter ATP-binding protein [Stappia taiwanensis]
MTPPRLEVRDLGVTLSGKPIVTGVGFSVPAGTLTAIVGPNGSGKSTVMRAVTGELAHSGAVRINGATLSSLSPAALAALRGVLPQHTSLSFPLSVMEVVRLGLLPPFGPGNDRDARVRAALQRVDLAGFEGRAYHSLSGGEQQRVQLARVLCQVWEPCSAGTARWLFLDEPVSSLDIRHQILIMRIAADFAARGGGVVAVMHDLNLTAMFAGRLLVMKSGRLLADGAPEAVLRDDLISEAFDHPLRVGALPARGTPFVLPQAAQAAQAAQGATRETSLV